MDINIHYIEKGQGEPLILLHGNGEDNTYFKNQIDLFAKYYHVYAIDSRGHGKTSRGKKELSIKQFSQDLKDFFDMHQIKKAHILGFSDGGNVALVFAHDYPQMVLKLILNGANLFPNGLKKNVFFPIKMGYIFSKLFCWTSQKVRLKNELLGLMVKDIGLSINDLVSFSIKTLVIVGNNDMIKESHTRLIANSIKDSKMVIINGNHFIASNNPKEFNEVVLDFLLTD